MLPKDDELYGRSSPYFVPHNLYYDLTNETFSPSLHQLFALSRVSGYRLNDWLRVFGFRPRGHRAVANSAPLKAHNGTRLFAR